MATFEEAKQIKRKHSAALLQRPGICGVDVQTEANGEPAICIHVDNNMVVDIPTQLDGIPVKCLHTGPYQKQE